MCCVCPQSFASRCGPLAYLADMPSFALTNRDIVSTYTGIPTITLASAPVSDMESQARYAPFLSLSLHSFAATHTNGDSISPLLIFSHDLHAFISILIPIRTLTCPRSLLCSQRPPSRLQLSTRPASSSSMPWMMLSSDLPYHQSC